MMSNTIEIVITGTNNSVAATKAAKEGIDSVGTAAEKTTLKLAAEDREAQKLERQLAELAAEAKLLGVNLDSVGNSTDKMATKTGKARDELGRFKKDTENVAKDIGKGLEGGGKGKGFFSSLFGNVA